MHNRPIPGSSGDDRNDVEKGSQGHLEPAPQCHIGWPFQCHYARFTAREPPWVLSWPPPHPHTRGNAQH